MGLMMRLGIRLYPRASLTGVRNRSVVPAITTCGSWTQRQAARCGSGLAGQSALFSAPRIMGGMSKHAHGLQVQHTRGLYIQTSPTPNEHALKFVPGVAVTPNGTSVEFLNMKDAGNSPLARRLLVIDGVKGVFLGPDFITIMKDPEVEWAVLKPEVFEGITVAFSNNETVLEDHVEGQEVITDTTILPDDSEVVAMIKELLETRVKPAVAEDGGSIIYRGFEPDSGVVKVELQGACSSCSSSSVTLKMGVQNMLMHYIPEVKSVEEVKSQAQEVSDATFQSMEERLKNSGHLRS